MKAPRREREALATLDALIEQITVDAAGDDDKLWAFRQTLNDHIVVPCEAFLIGEPVSVIKFDYRHNAYKMLMKLCEADLRCLDAHAHLGNFVFDHRPDEAIRHYEVGLRIGELSLGDDFDGLLPWGHIDNRPFLRCMHGYGLCCWRLGRFEEAERVFERMLWLNPSDNQGVRFLIDPVQARVAWKDGRDGR